LEILPRLFSRILVPPAVWDEVTVRGSGSPGAREVSQASWIEIETPEPHVVEPLAILVDRGEAEAIALAHMWRESTVLLDDARARRVAERLNIPRIGTLGVLRRAKQAGLLDTLRPLLEALQAGGIYIRQELIDAVLKSVGE
jgi:predicted nucleic acid-binding protein